MTLKDQLIRDEGLRLKPYKDSVGKLTIGVGRNLDDVGISADEADIFLQNDIQKATDSLLAQLPWVTQLDEVRQAVLINMTFNMGLSGLLQFRNTLKMIQSGDYSGASKEMLNSVWAKQVGPRAQRLSLQLETGEWK